MEQIYLDNAATSFPKAPGLGDAVQRYIESVGANVNRSSYAPAAEAESALFEARELLCQLFSFGDASHVAFTPGATHSLNYVLKGMLRPGDHVIASPFDHNAVLRPLAQLEGQGVRVSFMPFDAQGNLDFAGLDALFSSDTKLAICTHASNVFGNILPIPEISALCAAHGVPLALDCAQTAGHIPIDFGALGLSALCFPGHKGLLGPQGVGGMLLSHALAAQMEPLVSGGTGSFSHLLSIPGAMPDRFESGTLPIPAIYGLRHSLRFLLEHGVEKIARQESLLCDALECGLSSIPGIRVHRMAGERTGVLSISFLQKDNGDAAFALAEMHGVMTRCGLHCAPLAHRAAGTFPEGTVRFSVGYANTLEQIALAAEAVGSVAAC